MAAAGAGLGAAGAAALQSRMLQVDKRPLIQAALPSIPPALIGIIGGYANETQGGLYGPEAWKRWKNIDILDVVPPAPSGDLRGVVCLYIPLRISIGGRECELTLTVLKEVCSGSFSSFDSNVEQQLGETTASGWVRLDEALIEDSRGKYPETQKRMVEARGCSMQRVVESVALNLIVFDFTGVRLYRESPMEYTRCDEKVNGKHHVIVGGFGSDGLGVSVSLWGNSFFGVACALRSSKAIGI